MRREDEEIGGYVLELIRRHVDKCNATTLLETSIFTGLTYARQSWDRDWHRFSRDVADC